MDTSTAIWMIGFPLAGAALLGLSLISGKWIAPKWAGWIASAFLFLSFTRAFALASEFMSSPEASATVSRLGSWMAVGGFELVASLRIDALASVMCLVVTGVGLMIHIYSIGYMAHDESRVRYFAYLNLFCAFMLLLVSGSSLPLMFVGWEGVGLCSYLLIGFWFKEKPNARAGKKAFLVNRIGDAGFLLGVFLLFTVFHTLEVSEMASNPNLRILEGTWVVEIITLLLFIGCVGKSAQFPLYIWLPDAMAGPTPVSALIHAATMVTAGVYLLARMSFLYKIAPITSELVAWTGAFTALFAATIAVAQKDIKKILAFSTVSQLGFMVLAMGVGVYGAGVFHLVTHAFFKALLFLAAGSVIHAMNGVQDIRKMGGLKNYLVGTTVVFFAGYLAIIGFPFFSGWFSKDEILYGVMTSSLPSFRILFWIAFATALLTTFYMTRLFCLVFLDIPRMSKQEMHGIHESPPVMLWPMWLLAGLSFLGGTSMFPFHETLEEALPAAFRARSIPIFGSEGAMGWSLTLLVLAVAAVSMFVYLRAKNWLESLHRLDSLGSLLERQYRIDDLLVLGARSGTYVLGSAARLFDTKIIDGLLHRTANIARGVGSGFARLQTGFVQAYALVFLIGSFFVGWFLFRGVR